MNIACPSCATVGETVIAGWKSRSAFAHDATGRALIEVGLPQLADWVACHACGYDGLPGLTTESCVELVHGLEREGGTLARRRDYGAAIVRFIRTLAVVSDYTPSVAAIACLLMDAAADCGPDDAGLRAENLKKADSLLWMAMSVPPALPCVYLLLGRLDAEQGRADSARRWYLQYVERQKRAAIGDDFHRVGDYPHDATEEARLLLYDLPQLYRPCLRASEGGWLWSPWRETTLAS